MSVHQTKDGRWFVAYRRPDDRVVRKKYFGHGPEGKVKAKKWEADYLREAALPSATAAEKKPDLTFAELAQRYLDAKPLAARTMESLVYALNLHVLPSFGSKKVSALSMAQLTVMDEKLAKLGRALGTRNRIRTYCKAICQWGLDNELTANHPFSRFKAETKKEGRAPDLWYGSSLLRSGADLKAVSELLGHSSPNLTLSTYYHLVEGQKRAALNHLNIPKMDNFSQPNGQP